MDYNSFIMKSQLRHLGKQTPHLPGVYDPGLLDAFENKFFEKNDDHWVSLICPEFTSLCPKTQQPDFATIHLNYIPHKKMVESKSLKLYLFSFRNHGSFHEECIHIICQDLMKLMQPNFIEVIGKFTPRGGIAIHPYTSWARNEVKYQELKEYRKKNYPLTKKDISLFS